MYYSRMLCKLFKVLSDEFEEMERLAQMDESPAPCAGPPMPQFHESPGEAQRIRRK